MCTVTIVPTDKGQSFRLGCNRDESRKRSAALPPVVRRFGRYSAIMPIDPASGGTWIAVNDAGVAMTLLNVNIEGGPGKGTRVRSRGEIIPSLLDCGDVVSAGERAEKLRAEDFEAFRLVIADLRKIIQVRSHRTKVNAVVEVHSTGGGPVMFTSSGLGDHLVEGPRRKLFDEMFNEMRTRDDLLLQEEFHRHRRPAQTQLSVNMSRADARTVSWTVVEVTSREVSLRYHGAAPDEPEDDVRLELPRALENG